MTSGDSFRDFCSDNWMKVFKFFKNKTGNSLDAEDLTQTVFMKMTSKINNLGNSKESLEGYMWKIVKNQIKDIQKKLHIDMVPLDAGHELTAPEIKKIKKTVRTCSDRLEYGYTIREVSEQLGVSERTVRRISRLELTDR